MRKLLVAAVAALVVATAGNAAEMKRTVTSVSPATTLLPLELAVSPNAFSYSSTFTKVGEDDCGFKTKMTIWVLPLGNTTQTDEINEQFWAIAEAYDNLRLAIYNQHNRMCPEEIPEEMPEAP